jgi:hypothetical protein
MSSKELLAHFQGRARPQFFPGFSDTRSVASMQFKIFPSQTAELVSSAGRIVGHHSWPLLGFGEKSFGTEIKWHQDPLSGVDWSREYHKDIQLNRGDGSDARVLWELNRLGHLITLSRAYLITSEEKFGAEVFLQLNSWNAQNPLGSGANWMCAMEVALRAMNLLGVLQLLQHAEQMNEQALSLLLTLLDQHGTYIQRNLEFSYLATSNHYLSDVAGLLWLGLMLPELADAEKWRRFGLRELLREMDKQVLSDGADFESSTGYHRFALELFLYSFILCSANNIEIEKKYWSKLRAMLEYVRAYLRPDGLSPLIGDSDSGQVFPICRRLANDHEYVLALGAVIFNDSKLKPEPRPRGVGIPEELLWLLGEQGVKAFQELPSAKANKVSEGFPDAGTYILRDGDLYLCFSANGAGINGRGSHGHNDALSIEVSACGSPFIVDPGTYLYTADLHERHHFRSTAYHSTVEIDGIEQNTISTQAPFIIGEEARPRVLLWETGVELDRVIAEHDGYGRLPQPVTHRRSVTFVKKERWWLVEDEFTGGGNHSFVMRFHFDSGLHVKAHGETVVQALDQTNGARLLVCSIDQTTKPDFEDRFTSSDYGEKRASIAARWTFSGSAPCSFRWAILPLCNGDDEADRLNSIGCFVSNLEVD